MPGVTLDTGALIAIARGGRRPQALLDGAAALGTGIAVPAGVVAQAWRGSGRQARPGGFLRLAAVSTVALDEAEARATGTLCAPAGTSDVVDASVVICARTRNHAVVTGDVDDLRALDRGLRIVSV